MKTIYIVRFYTERVSTKLIALDNRELAHDFVMRLVDKPEKNNAQIWGVCDLITPDEAKIIEEYL